MRALFIIGGTRAVKTEILTAIPNAKGVEIIKEFISPTPISGVQSAICIVRDGYPG